MRGPHRFEADCLGLWPRGPKVISFAPYKRVNNNSERTFAKVLSILSFGTPDDLAILNTAAREVFFVGSTDPPSGILCQTTDCDYWIGRTTCSYEDVLDRECQLEIIYLSSSYLPGCVWHRVATFWRLQCLS